MSAGKLSTGLFSMAEFQGELRPAALYQLRSLLAPSVPPDRDGFQVLPEAALGAVSFRRGPAPAHGPASANKAIPVLAWRCCHPAAEQCRSFLFVVNIEDNTASGIQQR